KAAAGAEADIDALAGERATREVVVVAVEVADLRGELAPDVECELRPCDDIRRKRRPVRQWQVQQHWHGDVLDLQCLIRAAIIVELGALAYRQDLRLNAEPADAEADKTTAGKARGPVSIAGGTVNAEVGH